MPLDVAQRGDWVLAELLWLVCLRWLFWENESFSPCTSSLVKTLAGLAECGFWARALRAASPRESDWGREVAAELSWARPAEMP